MKWATDGVTSGMHTAEDWVNKTSHKAAGAVAGVPILGRLAEGAADAVSFQSELLGGVLGGATSMVGGVVNAVAHPIDTVKGLEALAEHIPGPAGQMLRMGHEALNVVQGKESFGQAIDNSFNPMVRAKDDAKFWGNMGSAIIDPYRQSAREGRYGEVGGRALFDIGSMLIGAGEANAGVKGAGIAADAARAAEVAADVGRAGGVASDVGRVGEIAGDMGRARNASSGNNLASASQVTYKKHLLVSQHGGGPLGSLESSFPRGLRLSHHRR